MKEQIETLIELIMLTIKEGKGYAEDRNFLRGKIEELCESVRKDAQETERRNCGIERSRQERTDLQVIDRALQSFIERDTTDNAPEG